MHFCVVESPLGPLRIEEQHGGISRLERVQEPLCVPGTPLLRECVRQLEEYFQGRRRDFALPLDQRGTAFQLRAWQELQRIPYGETISYGEQARRMGNAKACRAVGGSNHRNPICIIVPCHRVVGSNGSLTGYGGGVDMKAWLLAHEQSHMHK